MPSRTRARVKDTRSKVFKFKRFEAIRGLRAYVCRYVVPPRLSAMARCPGGEAMSRGVPRSSSTRRDSTIDNIVRSTTPSNPSM